MALYEKKWTVFLIDGQFWCGYIDMKYEDLDSEPEVYNLVIPSKGVCVFGDDIAKYLIGYGGKILTSEKSPANRLYYNADRNKYAILAEKFFIEHNTEPIKNVSQGFEFVNNYFPEKPDIPKIWQCFRSDIRIWCHGSYENGEFYCSGSKVDFNEDFWVNETFSYAKTY